MRDTTSTTRRTPTTLGDFEFSYSQGDIATFTPPKVEVPGARGEVAKYFEMIMASPDVIRLVNQEDLTPDQVLRAGRAACDLFEEIATSSNKPKNAALMLEDGDRIVETLAEDFLTDAGEGEPAIRSSATAYDPWGSGVQLPVRKIFAKAVMVSAGWELCPLL